MSAPTLPPSKDAEHKAARPALDCEFRHELYRRSIAQQLQEMDRHQLGQLIRFLAHFVDKITRWEKDPKLRGDEHRDKILQALAEWRRRAYEFGPDMVWAEEVLRRYETYRKTHVKMIVRPSGDDPVGPLDVLSMIKNRRSVRFWKKQAVERNKIETIIQAALEAPSSCNKMAWRFFVYENELDCMVEGDCTGASMTAKAPVRILLAVDERFYREIYAPALDAGLALQNLILAAHALGLGACLVYETAITERHKLPEGLDIPEYLRIYCAVLLGYPDESPIKPERVSVRESLTYMSKKQPRSPRPAPKPSTGVEEVGPVVTLPVEVVMPDGTRTSIALQAAAQAETAALKADGVAFSIAEGKHLYFSSKGDANFSAPPRDTALLLHADAEYILEGQCTLEGGAAALWIIEYDPTSRLGHQRQPLASGPFRMSWRTQQAYSSCCVAVRVSGTGRLALSNLRLSAHRSGEATPAPANAEMATVEEVKCGPQGCFRAYSIFLDPAGYRAYGKSHHRFYDDRTPSWYAKVIEPLRGCSSVLDIGCGPGLLLQALQAAGVSKVVGVERDAHYLQACRERRLSVFEHDLNQPMPFLKSESFDGIMAHQVFDYLCPMAIRNMLRESHRLLKPGGMLCIISRSDGQASGDITRTVPLTSELLDSLLREAGFEEFETRPQQRSVRVMARRSATGTRWPVRTVTLRNGQQVLPWSGRRSILSPTPDAWDQLSRRDFAILTTPDKREVRVDGRLVGYYTGYRESNGTIQRAIFRATSEDGITWQREPVHPVLEAGPPNAWDAGGLLAGSVVATGASSETSHLMFYSGRTTDGVWAGVAIARSTDGVHWEKDPEPVLKLDAFTGLKYLALADVMRTSTGRWLMHCEGWTSDSGWSVVQANSPDGLHWQPTQATPVIHPRQISWGGVHVANPKCLEIGDGHLVLGFNAADASLGFQLGLAESSDGLDWTCVDADPLLCTGTDEYRIESFFMTRDAWERSDQRLYFFRSRTRSTDTSSEVLIAEADTKAGWVGAEWKTLRSGLYRIREDRLIADAGATRDAHALSRTVALDRETQCALRLEPESRGQGCIVLRLCGGQVQAELAVRGDGQCAIDGEVVVPSAPQGEAMSLCLRVLGPDASAPEAFLQVWHDGRRVLQRAWPIGFAAECMQISIQVPHGEPSLIVDHLDIWQPMPARVEGYADAQQSMGVTRGGQALPDSSVADMTARFAEDGIGRALVMPYGNGRLLDPYDAICALAATTPTRVYPLYRRSPLSPGGDDDYAFELAQLEVLWQEGLLFGLSIVAGVDDPPREVLDWLEKRQLLTFWQVARSEQVGWIEEHILARFSFPVLLKCAADRPESHRTQDAAIQLLSRHAQVYLVAGADAGEPGLRSAIQALPHQVLFGSDYPAVNPVAARTTIEQLDLPAEHKALVLGENLRFLTERAQWHRWNALQNPDALMFRRLPATPQDLAEQGFKVVGPGEMAPAEPESAKTFWGTRGRVAWYERNQPWRTMIADLVKDLGARSVLEFGCNVGQNLAAIHAACPDVQLVGFDINPEAVQLGKEKTGLDLRLGDERALDAFPDGQFDLVFTVSVIDHVANVDEVCRRLLRVAGRHLYLLEVRLPLEGKVVEHYDHHHGKVRTSTGASYSWQLEKYLEPEPRIWRLDKRPVYLHSLSLGPYYWEYLAFLNAASNT